MKTKAEEYRENAANCGEMATTTDDEPNRNRYKRMQEAWTALAEEVDWLEGHLKDGSSK